LKTSRKFINISNGYGSQKRLLILTFALNKLEMSKEVFNTDKAPDPVGLYPHARKVGNLLFLSGVGPREKGNDKIPGVDLDEQGNIVNYDIEAQTHSVFKNVKNILEASGSSWNRLVDVTVYLTNMKDDFKVYNRIWAEYFPENAPCRTTIEINALPTPIAIELKCIATIAE
jgi:2-aminomuconate deaminase